MDGRDHFAFALEGLRELSLGDGSRTESWRFPFQRRTSSATPMDRTRKRFTISLFDSTGFSARPSIGVQDAGFVARRLRAFADHGVASDPGDRRATQGLRLPRRHRGVGTRVHAKTCLSWASTRAQSRSGTHRPNKEACAWRQGREMTKPLLLTRPSSVVFRASRASTAFAISRVRDISPIPSRGAGRTSSPIRARSSCDYAHTFRLRPDRRYSRIAPRFDSHVPIIFYGAPLPAWSVTDFVRTWISLRRWLQSPVSNPARDSMVSC